MITNAKDHYWIGHPGPQHPPGSEGAKIVASRERVEVLAEWGEDLQREYDDYAIVRLDGAFYLLNTSGCSCPSPADTWHVSDGPCGSVAALRSEVAARGGSLPESFWAEAHEAEAAGVQP